MAKEEIHIVFGLDVKEDGSEIGSATPIAAFFDKDEADDLARMWCRWATKGTVRTVPIRFSGKKTFDVESTRVNDAIQRRESLDAKRRSESAVDDGRNFVDGVESGPRSLEK